MPSQEGSPRKRDGEPDRTHVHCDLCAAPLWGKSQCTISKAWAYDTPLLDPLFLAQAASPVPAPQVQASRHQPRRSQAAIGWFTDMSRRTQPFRRHEASLSPFLRSSPACLSRACCVALGVLPRGPGRCWRRGRFAGIKICMTRFCQGTGKLII